MIYALIGARIQTNPRQNLPADLWHSGTRKPKAANGTEICRPSANWKRPKLKNKKDTFVSLWWNTLRFVFFAVSTILGRETKPLNLWNIFRGSSFVLAQIWSINHLLTFEKFRILKEVVKLTKHSWDFEVLILLFSVSPPLRFTYGI